MYHLFVNVEDHTPPTLMEAREKIDEDQWFYGSDQYGIDMTMALMNSNSRTGFFFQCLLQMHCAIPFVANLIVDRAVEGNDTTGGYD